MALLRVLAADGSAALQTWTIPPGGGVVGRTADADLSIDDPSVSRLHARIVPAEGAWMAVELQTSNGIVVAGRRVTTHPLKHGDVLTLGNVQVEFVEEDSREAQTVLVDHAPPSSEPPAASSSSVGRIPPTSGPRWGSAPEWKPGGGTIPPSPLRTDGPRWGPVIAFLVLSIVAGFVSAWFFAQWRKERREAAPTAWVGLSAQGEVLPDAAEHPQKAQSLMVPKSR